MVFGTWTFILLTQIYTSVVLHCLIPLKYVLTYIFPLFRFSSQQQNTGENIECTEVLYRRLETKLNETYSKQNFPPLILFVKIGILVFFFFIVCPSNLSAQRQNEDELRQIKWNAHQATSAKRISITYISTELNSINLNTFKWWYCALCTVHTSMENGKSKYQIHIWSSFLCLHEKWFCDAWNGFCIWI